MAQIQGLHPYHYQRVQELRPEDFPARVEFSNWVLNYANILPNILWSDESTFTRDKAFNIHNTHYWANENPRVIRRTNHQHRFSVNLWAGMVGNQLIGPIEIPVRLNSEIYLNFLQNQLGELLEDVPLEVRLGLYFQHDGAPAHFGLPVRNWLNDNYPNRWIGRGGPIAWPARSPDLNPLDYYFWGHITSIVYATEINSRDELVERIHNAGNQIRENNFQILQATSNIRRRARLCIREQGNHFEHLLKV